MTVDAGSTGTKDAGSTGTEDSCSYRSIDLAHGDYFNADECVDCGCNNSNIMCKIKGCPPTFCVSPLTFADICCDVCPYGKLLFIAYTNVIKCRSDTYFHTFILV